MRNESSVQRLWQPSNPQPPELRRQACSATSILVGQGRRLVCIPSATWHETEATPRRELSWASAPFSVPGCVASASFLWPLLCPCVDWVLCHLPTSVGGAGNTSISGIREAQATAVETFPQEQSGLFPNIWWPHRSYDVTGRRSWPSAGDAASLRKLDHTVWVQPLPGPDLEARVPHSPRLHWASLHLQLAQSVTTSPGPHPPMPLSGPPSPVSQPRVWPQAPPSLCTALHRLP